LGVIGHYLAVAKALIVEVVKLCYNAVRSDNIDCLKQGAGDYSNCIGVVRCGICGVKIWRKSGHDEACRLDRMIEDIPRAKDFFTK
jgi:hypothetical protein